MDNNNTEEKLPEQETIDAPEPQAKWVFILNWKIQWRYQMLFSIF